MLFQAGFGFGALLLLAGVAAWGSHREEATISSFRIEGTRALQTSSVERKAEEVLSGSYFHLFSRSNALIYPRGGLRASLLESFPRIEKVSVRTENFTTLRLDVIEREPFALWCPHEKVDGEERRENEEGGIGETLEEEAVCLFLDERGFIFDDAPEFTGNVYVRFLGGGEKEVGFSFIAEEEFSYFKELTVLLKEYNFSVESFIILNERDGKMMTDKGDVLFDRTDSREEVLQNLRTVLASDALSREGGVAIDYIDLRFGNKVYYKLK